MFATAHHIASEPALMNTLHDIRTPEDIRTLVDRFYEKVNGDTLLAPIFNEVAQVDWPKHLPVIYGFWESMLLGVRTYQGAPFPKHALLPVQKEHFARWLALFVETVDAHFRGRKLTKRKAAPHPSPTPLRSAWGC